MVDKTITCKRCEEETSLDDVRYVNGGEDIICASCHQKSKSGQGKKNNSDKVKYRCLNCNYKFSLKKDSKIKERCPYCDSEDLMLRDKLKADNIINQL